MPSKRFQFLAVAALAAASQIGCLATPVREVPPSSPHRAFRLEPVLSGLAGKEAIDCGSATQDGDRTPIDDCVINAFRSHRPFFATYEDTAREIEDVLEANGFVGRPDGVVYFYRYGFAPYHSQDPEESFSLRKCSGARVVTGSSGARALACW